MSAICRRIGSIQVIDLPETVGGCEDCLAIGGTWVHLRKCQVIATATATARVIELRQARSAA